MESLHTLIGELEDVSPYLGEAEWNHEMPYYPGPHLDQHFGTAAYEASSSPLGLANRDEQASGLSEVVDPPSQRVLCARSKPMTSSLHSPPGVRGNPSYFSIPHVPSPSTSSAPTPTLGIAPHVTPPSSPPTPSIPSTSSDTMSPVPRRKVTRGAAASSVCTPNASVRKGGKPHPMVVPTKSQVKKRKTSPSPPSKRMKNFVLNILSKYTGVPYVSITTPDSVIKFNCEIRKVSGKTSKPKSEMIAFQFTTHDEIETHLRVIINSSLTELNMRNMVSTGNIVYPLYGGGIMVNYTVSHTAAYYADVPGIVDHMKFVEVKIINAIMSEIKSIGL